MTLDELRMHVTVIQRALRRPLVFVMHPSQYSAIASALGYKAWIESKGKRGHKPPRKWLQ